MIFFGETLVATDFLHASPVWSEIPGPVRNPAMSDTIEYYYPAEKIASDALRRAELPLDNPFVFNGTPIPHGVHIWNSVWPVKLLFLGLFDPLRSYDFFAIFHWWLAGVAMTAYLRHLGRSGWAAFAGALAFVLSARASTWLHGHYMMATLAYAPLAFLWGERRSRWAALPIAGLFFTNPQAALAVAAVLFLRERGSWRRSLSGGLLAGIALVPLWFTMREGIRHPGVEAAAFWQEGPRTWLLALDLVWPGFWQGTMTRNEYAAYLGLLPLLGVVLAWKEERFWARVMVVVLAAATVWPIPVLLAPVTFSLATRYLFLFAIGGAVLFSRALDRRPLPPWAMGTVILLVVVDLAPRFYAYNRPYDPAPLRERPLDLPGGRVGWILEDHGQLQRPVTPPLSLFGIASVQGYDVMVPKAQAEAMGAAGWVRGDRLIELKDPDSPKLEALGLRWLLADRPLELTRFRPAGRSAGVWIYENPSAPDPPPRRSRRWPLALGAALSLAGIVASLTLRGKGGYS
ncbi:MAG TPA: hypothetical protein VF950_12660 [Planctomycetota bacterium]